MSFERADVLAMCSKYGPLLQVDQDLDGATVMAAIASNESSVGANIGPRHEPSYDVGGGAYKNSQTQRDLVAKYGPPAACSYGPWQLMFINVTGYGPGELETDLEANAKVFVGFFNHYVIEMRRAKTLQDIGETYNDGHILTGPVPPGVERYVEDLQSAYSQFKGMMSA